MKRIDENTIALTQAELDEIREFIQNSLNREWDRYTDNVICTDKWEDGVKRMDPEMYEMSQQMLLI